MITRGIRRLTFLALALTLPLALADEPSQDPARDVVEKLLQELKRSPQPKRSAEAPKLPNPTVESASPAEEVIRDLAKPEKIVSAEQYVDRARKAEGAGRLTEAVRILQSARRQHPEDAQIAGYLKSLQANLATRDAGQATLARATAHLAAGLTRGQQLMRQERYGQAVDLLEHVLKSADLFPSDAHVKLYAQLAARELQQYRDRVSDGSIVPETPIAAGEEPVLVPTASAAPVNARRVLKTVDSPLWYAQLKNRLAFQMSVDYSHEAVANVIDQIASQTGVNIQLDAPVVQSRSHTQSHVDFRIADVPAEVVLDLACSKAGLEYVLMEKGVVITTPARAARYLKDLPDAVRRNWLAARVVFPELNSELAEQGPSPSAIPGERADDESLDEDLPAYLKSGSALLADIKSLLRSP